MKNNVERRIHSRKEYKAKERPRLKIGKMTFEVVDISERGLKFINNKKINVEGWVSGTLIFFDHRSIAIDGIVIRKRDNEIGVHLVGPIDL